MTYPVHQVEGVGETAANTIGSVVQALMRAREMERQQREDALKQMLGQAQVANLQSETAKRDTETLDLQKKAREGEQDQQEASAAWQRVTGAFAQNGSDINSSSFHQAVGDILARGVRRPGAGAIVAKQMGEFVAATTEARLKSAQATREQAGATVATATTQADIDKAVADARIAARNAVSPDLHFTDVNGTIVTQNPKTGRVVATYRVPGQGMGGMNPEQYGNRLESLTRIYNSETQQLQNSAMGYMGVKAAAERLQRSPDWQTEGPTINSLFYEYARLRDPTGRLSDQDVAMSQKGGTIAERARNIFGTSFKGRLDPEWLSGVVRDMERLRMVRERELNYYIRISNGRARSAGIDPSAIHLANPFQSDNRPPPEIVP